MESSGVGPRYPNQTRASRAGRATLPRRSICWSLLAAIASIVCVGPTCRAAVTPESPEVKALIESGLARAAAEPETRLGGKCLVALALVKLDQPRHPRVQEAIAECRRYMQSGEEVDIYSNGLAIIFLCEAGPRRYLSEIQFYLGKLLRAQKPHGGWGYATRETGDTSQTQYAALALWTAHRHGSHIEPKVVARLADYLFLTQDPEGAWGYQAKVGTSDRSTAQVDITPTMLAAGLSSVLICADLFGVMPSYGGLPVVDQDFKVPTALRTPDDEPVNVKLALTTLDPARFPPAVEAGNRWLDAHFDIEAKKYKSYYLYALERYKSFQELHDGVSPSSPDWYQQGYEFLKASQDSGGGWNNGCGFACDSAFGVLFLYRSTQKTLRASLGEGALTAGRGLPANVANAVVRQGQIVVRQVTTELDNMLALVDEEQGEALDQLAASGVSVDVDQLDANNARRLQQLVRAPGASARLLAVRALGRSGNLDFVQDLIYALSDPDRRIVLEARNGLQFISRRFEGFGPPNSFDESQRSDAIERWKRWFLTIRPETVFER